MYTITNKKVVNKDYKLQTQRKVSKLLGDTSEATWGIG